MAVASVEENVKLKDLWQARYTVAMLKSMKTVTFETPSGNHAYTVVMVVYSTQGVCGVYDPAFVLVCCCGLLCTHLRDPVPRFRRHPFSDYGLASVCVCVCGGRQP